MPLTSGIVAALLAPILEAVGFLEWDIHWKKGGGSAFALNLYKCTLAAFGFFSMACFTNNLAYMQYAQDWSLQSHSPWGEVAETEHARLQNLGIMSSNWKVPETQQSQENLQQQNFNGIINNNNNINHNHPQLESTQLSTDVTKNYNMNNNMNNNNNIGQQIMHILPKEQPQNQQDLNAYWRQPPETQHQQQQPTQQQQSLSNPGISQGKEHQQNIPNNKNTQAFTQQNNLDLSTININNNNNNNNIQNNPQQNKVPPRQTTGHRNLGFFEDEEDIYLQHPRKNYLDSPPPQDSYKPLFFQNEHKIPPILLSSLLGIVIGDCAELEALRLIGARRVLVVDTFKPFAAAILGNWLLNEPLYTAAYLGMCLTVIGTYFVLMASIARLNVKKKKRRRAITKKRDYSPLDISDAIDNGNSMANNQERDEQVERGKPLYPRPLSRHDLSSEYDMSINEEQLEADEYMMLFEEERGMTSQSICCFKDKGQLRNRNNKIFHIDNHEVGLKSNFKESGSFGSAGSLGAGSWGSYDGIDIDDDLRNDDYETNNLLDHDPMEHSSKFQNQTTQYFSKSLSRSQLSPTKNDDWSVSTSQHKKEQTNTTSQPLKRPSGVLKKSRYSASSFAQTSQPLIYIDDIEKESKKLFNETQRESSSIEMNDIPLSISPIIDDMIFAEENDKQQSKKTPVIDRSDMDEVYHSEKSEIPRNNSFDTTSTASTVMVKNQDESTPKKNPMVEKPSPPSKIMRSSSSGSCGSFGSSNGSSISSECGPPAGWYINSKESVTGRKIRLRTGYALAFLNVIFDAYGSYLTKKHAVGMTTWEINLLRMGFAATILIFLTSFMRFREWKRKKKGSKERLRNETKSFEAPNPYEVEWYKLPKMSIFPWIIVSIGVLFVTFLCPALTNYALMDIPMALAVTLTSVTPLYMIPLSWMMKGEKLTAGGYFGALIAVSGVIILCIWGTDTEEF